MVFVDLVDDAHNFFEGRSWTWFTMGSGGADFGFFHYDLVNIKLETYGNGAVCHPGTSDIVPCPAPWLALAATSRSPGPVLTNLICPTPPTPTGTNKPLAGVSFKRTGTPTTAGSA